jgi:hypothetical protein
LTASAGLRPFGAADSLRIDLHSKFNIQDSTLLMITEVLPFSDLKHLAITPTLLDPNSMVAVIGDLSGFPPHRTTIINSRQHRLPYADDPWLAATSTAVARAVSSNSTIISSVGMITWEWIVWNTTRLKGHQIVIIPRGKVASLQDRVRQIIDDFDLDTECTVFLMPFSPKDKPFRKSVYPERDRWATALSHCIQPLAVRPSGIMSRLLSEPKLSGIIDPSYRLALSRSRPQTDKLKLLISKSDVRAIQAGLSYDISNEANSRDYLTHWTRACHGSWPGERRTDFYAALYSAGTGYPRDGLSTLRRILTEGTIHASGRMMPGGVPMTSLTATSPAELLKIIRWRPGYIRWNFEPYGISIRRRLLESLGAKEVTYGTDDQYEKLDVSEQPFFQKNARNKDWRIEEEWRLPGDLSLQHLKNEDAIIWVLNQDQIHEIQKVSRFPVRWLLK